jgi:hypothetical protein
MAEQGIPEWASVYIEQGKTVKTKNGKNAITTKQKNTRTG